MCLIYEMSFMLFLLCWGIIATASDVCDLNSESCDKSSSTNRYKAQNTKWIVELEHIYHALNNYSPSNATDCSCYTDLIYNDLETWKDGITKELIDESNDRGVRYQIINHVLYREKECMFPFRCSGVEHFVLELLPDLLDMEFILNTRDWPQVPKHMKSLPVFSFSKTANFWDITYPAWTFWEGGPAIGLYPTGLGRWDLHRDSVSKAGEKWPWTKKKSMAFFRGSRTSSERDPLILLSRSEPHLVNAQYTKNQAWKSDADTLHAKPADEVSLEDHCQYKYLFNFRGVAASFRFKHLLLCKSLVFHVGDEWMEFFYQQLKPWVHYIPINAESNQEDIKHLLLFAQENEKEVKEIANRGFEFIWKHLRMEDISCYWKTLLQKYSELLKYKPVLNKSYVRIRAK